MVKSEVDDVSLLIAPDCSVVFWRQARFTVAPGILPSCSIEGVWVAFLFLFLNVSVFSETPVPFVLFSSRPFCGYLSLFTLFSISISAFVNSLLNAFVEFPARHSTGRVRCSTAFSSLLPARSVRGQIPVFFRKWVILIESVFLPKSGTSFSPFTTVPGIRARISARCIRWSACKIATSCQPSICDEHVSGIVEISRTGLFS